MAKGITILDQNGRVVPNAQPSATRQIFDVVVGPSGNRVFMPSTLNIAVGDTVRWTWASSNHSVTSGNNASCTIDSQFCSPNDMNCPSGTLSDIGTVYQHTFTAAGSYSYFCAAHCISGMVGTINVAPSCTSPPPNMISWWPGDGNGFDIVDGNNLGAGNGNGFGFGAGEVGQAFTFNGSQFATPGTPSNLVITGTAVTLDGWINPSVADSNVHIYFGRSVSGGNDYLLLANFGQLTGVIKTSGGEAFVSSGTILPINTWSHIALTYDGATVKVYLNGALNASAAKTGNISNSNSPFVIGGRADGNDFTGAIDEVEVFNRTLMASEIAAIFNAGSTGKCRTCTPPPANMVTWWPGEGNARDIQGGNNGALLNGVTFATGKVGQAFSFDGVDDRVEIANAASLNPTTALTLDAWVNPQALTLADSTVIAKSSESLGQRSYGMWITNDGRVHVEPSSLGTSYADTAPGVIPLNTWTHVAAVITAGVGFKIYVNGVEQSITLTGSLPTLSVTSVPVMIGNSDLVARNWLFKGLIDDPEIFDRALTATEISAIVNAGNAGKCKAPQPISAFSRKTHGGAGTFDIDLTPNTTAGVECRSGGASGIYQMIVQFASPVTVTGATVLSGTGSASGFSVSGAVVMIDLTGVTNAQTIVVKLAGVNDGTLSGDVPVAMGVLLGDTNGNGSVSASDIAQTKANSGQVMSASNFRTDVNVNGSINGSDVALVKSKAGTALP